jgi:hypothetical protein
MVKIGDTRAALERYDLRRSEDHRLDPCVPDDPGTVHAYLVEQSWLALPPHSHEAWIENRRGPLFAEKPPEWSAACGKRVRVILPLSFDTNEPTACPQGAETA